MSKKTKSIDTQAVAARLDQLRDALVDSGRALPAVPSHVTDDDLSLYGKGRAKTIDELQSVADAVRSRTTAQPMGPIDSDIANSMAMAARNGELISESVRARMDEDRRTAESSPDKP